MAKQTKLRIVLFLILMSLLFILVHIRVTLPLSDLYNSTANSNRQKEYSSVNRNTNVYPVINQLDHKEIKNNLSLHKIKPIQSKLSTSVAKMCNPTYIIDNGWGYNHHSYFLKYGFTLNCTIKERKQLGIKTPTRIFPFCWKYNIDISFESPFCNGGKLIRKDYDTFCPKFHKALLAKTALNELLTTYCNKYDTDDSICNFVLLSYDMSIQKERIAFLTQHIDCNNNKPQYDKTWLFKEDKDRGIGIHIYNNHQSIYRLIVSSPAENIPNCSFNPIKNNRYLKKEGFNYIETSYGFFVDKKGLLMQTFVNNPLLLVVKPDESIKHVFHLRSYFMFASFSNPLIVLHWPKFILMINPNEYNRKKLEKKNILSNRHVSRSEEMVDDYYQWIWGPAELQMYLEKVYGDTLINGNYTTTKLNNDLKHILKNIFQAYAYVENTTKIDMHPNELYFDTNWCMDIIINDQLELKLMELNTYCGFFCNDTKLIHKKQNGVYDWDCDGWRDQATEIILEVFSKKSQNITINKIDSLNDYEIAFWEESL